jgi:hypothetical protein
MSSLEYDKHGGLLLADDLLSGSSGSQMKRVFTVAMLMKLERLLVHLWSF